jgi:hypothetical protein
MAQGCVVTGSRANFFEKTVGQWAGLAAFSPGRPSLLLPRHLQHLPPSETRAPGLSHSSQTQVWAIAC